MGWTGIPTKKSIETIFEQEFANPQFEKKVLLDVPRFNWDESNVEEKEAYLLMRTKENELIVIVVLFKKDDEDVLYKEMSEDMGPYTKTRCPKDLLKMATPVEKLSYAGYAKEWRERQ
jgi:hypothetical protein